MSMGLGVSLRWVNGFVEISLYLPPMPPLTIGMTPEEFFATCDGMAEYAGAFIAGVKEAMVSGDTSELKADLPGLDIDSLTKLKRDYEENRGTDDEERP